MVESLRKHAGKKQRIVANMFSHLALAIERWRGPINRIGFKQHLAHIAQGASVSIFDFVECFRFAEFSEKVGYVSMHFRAAQTDFVIVPFNYFLEKPLERIRFSYHLITPFSLHPVTRKLRSSPSSATSANWGTNNSCLI